MGEFLQNNWFWIVLLVFFIWMHGSGMGCGGHGRHQRHNGDSDNRRRPEAGSHRH